MKNRVVRSRRLSVENLESRRVMAGSLHAEIVGGSLVVRGDNSANYVSVWQGTGTDVFVAGLKDPQAGGGDPAAVKASETLVNGSRTAVKLSGFTGGMRFEMNGGDDRAGVTKAHVRGSVFATLGAGDDEFGLTAVSPIGNDLVRNDDTPIPFGNVTVDGFTHANLDDGADRFGLLGVTLNGGLLVNGGKQNDSIQVASAAAAFLGQQRMVIKGAVTINPEGGDDRTSFNDVSVGAGLTVNDTDAANYSDVALTKTNVNGDISISTGRGKDSILLEGEFVLGNQPAGAAAGAFTANAVRLNTADGDDSVFITNARLNSVDVSTGAGGEGNGFGFGVSLNHLTVKNGINVNTGDGLDNISLYALVTRDLLVDTGKQSDGLILTLVDAYFALMNTGEGGDVVGVDQSEFDIVNLQLGGGDDSALIRNTEVTIVATIDGGPGKNYLNLGGGNKFARVNRSRI